MKTDSDYMQLALELATTAKGNTNPNPCVGAVVVKDGVIVGTGLHRKAGEPHAEVHAFNMAGEYAKGATLYVTLEPCSHYGKTPPCAMLVKESGVSRVVVAMMDPNPSVAGRGINILKEAGIEVEVGLLEQDARRLNERFIHNMLTNKPFVISKFAMTMDGKIATHNGHSKWITSHEARLQVHKLRHEMDGILVGVGTVLADNPSLTTRLQNREGKNPIRIILDSELKTPLEANIVNTAEAQTIIVSGKDVDATKVKQLTEKGVQILTVSKTEQGLNLGEMLDELYKLGITDVLVEGGAEINGSFLSARLINKVLIFMAPKILGGRHSKTPFAGMDIDCIDEGLQLEFDSIEQVGPDLCITAYPADEII